jgi:hypothetical protein
VLDFTETIVRYFGIIEKSEEPFVLSRFIESIFDPDFVKSQHYAELLVEKIPTNKRFDTLVAIYREKLKGDIYNVGLVIRALIAKLPEDQIKQYMEIVSEELGTITDGNSFAYNLHLLPPNLWEQLAEISKLRAENRVIKAIREGEVYGEKIRHGGLATWAKAHFQNFTLREQIGLEFIEKLESPILSSNHYVTGFFLLQLPNVIFSLPQIRRCIKAISNSVRQGDERIRNTLVMNIRSLPDKWQTWFAESLSDLTDEHNPEIYLSDGSPFLTSSQSADIDEEEDIPF